MQQEFINVNVTEIEDAVKFYAQVIGDPAIELVESKLKSVGCVFCCSCWRLIGCILAPRPLVSRPRRRRWLLVNGKANFIAFASKPSAATALKCFSSTMETCASTSVFVFDDCRHSLTTFR